jgi:hypothetical protein
MLEAYFELYVLAVVVKVVNEDGFEGLAGVTVGLRWVALGN